MDFPSHLSFGVFTGLLFYLFTQDLILSFLVFFIQIILILDFLFKKLINFEPLHTVIAGALTWLVFFIYIPVYHAGVAFAYCSHLFLDLFVKEDIPLLYPFTYLPAYPLPYSQRLVQLISWTGSALVLLFIFYI